MKKITFAIATTNVSIQKMSEKKRKKRLEKDDNAPIDVVA
jgi:hypothetical protein